MNRNGYLVRWYVNEDDEDGNLFITCDQTEVFKWVNKAKIQNLRIIIYEIGDMLLNWSEQ